MPGKGQTVQEGADEHGDVEKGVVDVIGMDHWKEGVEKQHRELVSVELNTLEALEEARCRRVSAVH